MPPKSTRKKAPGRAVGHRTQKVVELSPPPPKPPKLPVKNPTREVVEWWNELFASPLASAVDPSDMDKLRRLAVYKNDWQKIRNVIDSRGKYGGYVTEGSQGQMVESPFVKQLHKLEALIASIEGPFGGDPLSRLRLGMTMTDATKSQMELQEIMGGRADAHNGEVEEIEIEVLEEGTD